MDLVEGNPDLDRGVVLEDPGLGSVPGLVTDAHVQDIVADHGRGRSVDPDPRNARENRPLGEEAALEAVTVRVPDHGGQNLAVLRADRKIARRDLQNEEADLALTARDQNLGAGVLDLSQSLDHPSLNTLKSPGIRIGKDAVRISPKATGRRAMKRVRRNQARKKEQKKKANQMKSQDLELALNTEIARKGKALRINLLRVTSRY